MAGCPVGVNPQVAQGPFNVTWTMSGQRTLWLAGGQVLDFTQTRTTTATITGGGLATPRTVTARGQLPGGAHATTGTLSVDPAHVALAETAAAQLRAEQVERQFWGRTMPVLLLVAALLTLMAAVRARRRLAPPPEPQVEAPLTETRRNLHVR